jgi:hypothetical protein
MHHVTSVTYRVHINYQSILQNHIYTNTEQKYVMMWDGDQIPVGVRFSAPVQTSPGAHPVSCTMGTRSFQGVEGGQGVTLTPHLLLVSRSKNRVALYLCCL